MKSVMLSIQPKWCEEIASGRKTVEIRKTKPKGDFPFKVYIYCTNSKTSGDFILCKSNELSELFGFNSVVGVNKGFAKDGDISLKGKVIGEFVCDRIRDFEVLDSVRIDDYFRADLQYSALTTTEISEYIGIGEKGFAWHISDLIIYSTPKELKEFAKPDKCPYLRSEEEGCVYPYHCFRAGQVKRCGEFLDRPPQSWYYVEKVKN